jgi:hypothetical protein
MEDEDQNLTVKLIKDLLYGIMFTFTFERFMCYNTDISFPHVKPETRSMIGHTSNE